MKISKVFFLYFFIIGLSHSALAQFPLDVQVTIAPPYPIRLSDYTDFDSQIFIDVVNNNNEAFEIVFIGSLTNDNRGIRIETDPNSLARNCIMIEPGLNRLTGEDLRDVFNPNHLKTSGLSLNQIRADQALPEGNYSLCLRAFDCDLSRALSPQPEMLIGCTDFEVAYVDPPFITAPECGVSISEDLTSITFNWIFVPPAGGNGETQFKLRIVEIDPPGRNPFDVMNSATAPFLFESEELFTTTYNLLPDADVLLEEGKPYAFQVFAFDPTDEIQFKNNGASEVCHFVYGSATDGLKFLSAYPKADDYIPFNFFPFVMKFDPYSDDYVLLEGDFTLLEKKDGNYTEIDTKGKRNYWPNGALFAQRNLGFPEMSEDHARYITVYKTASEEPHSFERGVEYAWEFEGSVDLRDGGSLERSTARVEFKIGMSAPIPELPANKSTKEPGSVKFKWTSAKRPESLMPTLDITQFSGDSPINFFNGAIDERWVLEVSNSESFGEVIYTDEGRINGLEYGFVADSMSVINSLYKQIESDTIFTEIGQYYWRVKWLTNPDDLTSEAYSTSPVWEFKIGEEEVKKEVIKGPCVSGCDGPAISSTVATGGLTVGDTLKIGMFEMVVKKKTSDSDNKFTGEGEIKVDFLNLNVIVAFEDIEFNSAKQIFSGTVKAKEDRAFPYQSEVKDGVKALSMSQSTADELNDYLAIGERLVSTFTGNRAIGLPIGIDKEIEGNQYTVAVLEMEFTPERAALQAVVNIELDIFDDMNFLSAGIGDFCFSPNGFGKEGIAFLPVDRTFDLRNESKFVVKGLGSSNSLSDSTTYSYFNWDCNGLKCFNLAVEYTFARNIIVPDSEDGTPGEGEVTAKVNFKSCRGSNYMARIDMDAFQIPTNAMEGYAFVVDEAWLDLSTLENPPEFEENLPDNYANPTLSNSSARLRKGWKGFWLKKLHIKTPGYLSNVERENINAVANNLIIDNTGVSCSIVVKDLVTRERIANVDGYAFSIDSLYIDILNGSFTKAGLTGELGLPISGEQEFLEYKATLDHDTTKSSFKYVISPKEKMSIPIFIAKADIAPTSTIEMRLAPNDIFIGLDLNGSLSISSDNQPSAGGNSALNLNMPGVKIEHLRLNNIDGFDDSDFTYSLASPQKNMSGFPISLDELSLGLDGMNPALTIQPRLTLAGDNSGFSAAGKIIINSAISTENSGIKRFELTGIDLDAIYLDVETSAITLKGSLDFYKENSKKGIRGDLAVSLPAGIAAQFNADFGTFQSSSTAAFNTAQWYSYWYVDGMVTFGGVPLFSGLNLYGIGGGVYHHMSQASSLPVISSVMTGPMTGPNAESTTAPPKSGVAYQPNFDTNLGLKFKALFGSTNQGKSYNFDVTLEAAFSHSGGLTNMGFKGNARILSEGITATKAPIMGYVDVNYRKPPGGSKTLDGNMLITVDFPGVEGKGSISPVPPGYTGPTNKRFVQARFYVGPDKWYYHMGTPDNRGELEMKLADIAAINLSSYLMMGHDIPTSLPPPSAEFLRIFNGGNNESFEIDGADRLSDLQSGNLARSTPDKNRYENGNGLAFGSSYSLSLDGNPVPFYFDIDMAMGFDVNVIQDNNLVCAETGSSPGVNGWYASGQFYAAVAGNFGIQVNLFGTRRVSIFDLAAGMILKGGLPDPAWAEGKARIRYSVLSGAFKGNFNFVASMGQKCTTIGGSELTGVEIVQDLQPNGGNDISVFTSGTAAFALPINEILEIPNEEDGTLPPRRIMPFIESWTLKENNRKEVPCEAYTFSEENTVAELAPKVILKGQTSYTQRILLKATEFFNDAPDKLIDWEESVSKTFRTGTAPDHIVDENVVFTYPFKNQNFFLKGETQGSTGYVQMNQKDRNNIVTNATYQARFIKLGSDEKQEVPLLFTNDSTTLSFDVSGLENDTHYTIQILKTRPLRDYLDGFQPNINTNSVNQAIQSNTGSGNNAPSMATASVSNYELLSSAMGTVSSDVLKKRELPGPKVNNSRVQVLYYYYFKTDQHDKLSEKVGSISFSKNYKIVNNTEGFTFDFPDETEFDWLDGKGYTNTKGKQYKPLVNVYVKTSSDDADNTNYPVNFYYSSKISANINAPSNALWQTINRHSLPSMPSYNSFNYQDYVKINSGSPFKQPLSRGGLNRANNLSLVSTPRSSRAAAPSRSTSSNTKKASKGPFMMAVYRPMVIREALTSVRINHSLSVPGVRNFSRFKSELLRYLTRDLPDDQNESGKSNHFYTQYKNRFGSKYDVSRNSVAHYFQTFHPQQYSELMGFLFKSDTKMLYPTTTSMAHLHSFIMLYRYPLPGKTQEMMNGSNYRVVFTHNGN